MTRWRHALAAVALLGAGPRAAPRDPSPHRVSFVGVAPGVALEVLDWGGTGAPLVFLAGLGNTAHVFDEFAPRFTDRFHVLAITRRGYGASGHPSDGYDIGTLATDVAVVCDRLHLERVVLAGHSLAGDEMTRFASTQPDRVSALVYLDAAYDRTHMPAEGTPPQNPTPADLASIDTFSAFITRTRGMTLPVADLRWTVVVDGNGRLLRGAIPGTTPQAILRGLERPDYAHVQAPALAIYQPNHPDDEAAESFMQRSIDQFRDEMAHGRIVQLATGSHYVFVTNADEVVRLMRDFLSSAAAPPAGEARFEIPRRDLLIDERIPIVVTGVTPHASVTLELRGGQKDEWASSATFVADDSGTVDVAKTAPVRGSYKEIDAMGLFWSAERRSAQSVEVDVGGEDDEDEAGTPESWTLTAEVDGHAVARTTIRRRAVAEEVRITPVRTDGLVGTLYEPPTSGRHPGVIVLGGSEGGIPSRAGHAGGLASRGYTVLALGYFGADGLPRTLENIRLEYFGKAINWLAAQPSVDAARLGVVGASRGAELALLLGTIDPRLRVVVAYMPSNVVNRGCCDPRTWSYAWTIGGRPVATMPPPGRGNPVDVQRAEIQVERINGPILLVSGKDDGVWPSTESAAKIVARLQQHHVAFPHGSLVYEHAGHSLGRPYVATTNLNGRRSPASGRVINRGGTPSGTAKARDDSWPKMLAFVGKALSPDARPGS